MLAVKTREELSKNWTTIIKTHNRTYQQSGEEFRLPTDLAGELDVTGRMFEDMRYFYEGGDFAKHWFLSPLPDLLRSLILVRCPAWAEGAALVAGSFGIKEDETDGSSDLPGNGHSLCMEYLARSMARTRDRCKRSLAEGWPLCG